jgi:hypothetical protein
MQLQVNGWETLGAPHAAGERYDRFVARFVALFGTTHGRSTRELWSALDIARAELAMEGAVPDAQAKALRDCVGRDLAHLASVLVRGGRQDGVAIARLAERPGSMRLLLEALRLSGDGVYRLAGESGRVELRRAGEPTCAGTLACLACGSMQRSTQAQVAVPCLTCGALEFSKTLRT